MSPILCYYYFVVYNINSGVENCKSRTKKRTHQLVEPSEDDLSMYIYIYIYIYIYYIFILLGFTKLGTAFLLFLYTCSDIDQSQNDVHTEYRPPSKRISMMPQPLCMTSDSADSNIFLSDSDVSSDNSTDIFDSDQHSDADQVSTCNFSK